MRPACALIGFGHKDWLGRPLRLLPPARACGAKSVSRKGLAIEILQVTSHMRKSEKGHGSDFPA
jgi:hypothetical protein